MSQKNPSDPKGFAVGRGLLAAAETLNFSMNEQRSGPPGRSMGNMMSGMGGGGGDGQDRSPMSRRSGGGHLGSTMKLFNSLGLSPADLDALAQIPEEDISVESLPHILMQLKNRKGDAERRMAGSSRDMQSSDASYHGSRDGWDNMHAGRMGGPSMGQGSSRSPPPENFGFGSMQEASTARGGFDLDYGSNGSSKGRDRQYSEHSHRDSYGGLDMGPPQSDPVFMQRRMGSPSHGKVQDYLGVLPPMFPHVCSLCDFDVHSIMEWNQHINGLQHAGKRRQLLQMYPEWNPVMDSNRGGGSHSSESTNLSLGLLGPAPLLSNQNPGGMSSNWGHGFSGKNRSNTGQPKMRSRVVVALYDRKPNNKNLFNFTKPFGTLREHLVLKNKAFLEMETHREAVDMVNYYQENPVMMYGKPLTFYLSKERMVIEKRDDRQPGDRAGRDPDLSCGSHVVFFNNLPLEEEKKMELLTLAGRFGTVEKHLFLTDEAFVQLGTPEDAEMMVKYYTLNPLTICGRTIRLNICTKYKTLTVNRKGFRGGGAAAGGGGARGGGDSWSRKNTTTTTSSGASATKSSLSATKTPPSSSKSSTTRSKEEKKKEEKAGDAAAEGSEGAEPQGEEAKEVKEAQEAQGEKTQKEAQGEETQEEVSKGEETQEEAQGEEMQEEGPATGSAPEESPQAEKIQAESDNADGNEKAGGAADGGEGQGAESQEQPGPMDTEMSPEKPEKEDQSAAEEMMEGNPGEEGMDSDFLENMDDFVTLDEVADDEDDGREADSIDNSRKGGMRVVNLLGFRRGYGYLNELLALAKPFGEVVKHLVLDLRPEAYLQFETEEQAKAMAKFYNSNVTASVCGRPVRISHSNSYPTIQCGASRVIYIGHIPNFKYTDEDILKLSEPYGKVKKYFVNRIKRECFIELENAEDAEKMAEACKENPLKLQGKRLTVYISRKYKYLKYGHRRLSPSEERKVTKRRTEEPSAKRSKDDKQSDEEQGKEESKSAKHTEEPPAKRSKTDKPSGEEKAEEESAMSPRPAEDSSSRRSDADKLPEEEDNKQQQQEEEKEESAKASTMELEHSSDTPPGGSEPHGQHSSGEKPEEESGPAETSQTAPVTPAEARPVPASLPLPPYDPDQPIGVDFVKMGYYCRVCFLFYSNEETAKKVHCSSQTHYDKLQKHLEKEKLKNSGKKVKKSLE